MSVFDTSAILAMFYEEAGAAIAVGALPSSTISVVNVAEVAHDFLRSGRGDAEDATAYVSRLGLTVAAPTLEQAKRVAELKRIRGLSLADCFCIALGEEMQQSLVTADQLWASTAGIRTPIHLIR